MKGRIYGRESSDDTERAPPVETQIEMGKAWFVENGHEVAGIYKDSGLSGGNWNRPGFNQLIKELKKGEFVWAWTQGRLARDTEYFLWFVRQVREKGAVIALDTQFIDMETAGGILKHTIIAATDEHQRRETSDKVKRVYSHKLREVRKTREVENLKGEGLWGRAPIPSEITQEARRLHKERPELTVRQIAAMLPNYRLISKKAPTYRKPSYGWVAKILKTEPVKEYPTNQSEEKPLEKPMSSNNPIAEQKRTRLC